MVGSTELLSRVGPDAGGRLFDSLLAFENDPVYLTEPFVRSQEFVLMERGNQNWLYNCEYATELDKPRHEDVIAHIRDKGAGVPVLWRPYHEMNGGWFWWGRSPHYRALYRMLFDRSRQLADNLDAVDAAFPDSAAVRDVVAFLRSGGKRRFTIPRLSAAEAADDDDDES